MKKREKPDLSPYFPAGINTATHIRTIRGGFFGATGWSLWYLNSLFSEKAQLYEDLYGNVKRLKPGAVMPDFRDILGASLYGFFVLALAMAGLAFYYYIYHYQGSRSIYLMKRLPDKNELHKRCLTVPITVAALALVTAFIVILLYYCLYLYVTPEECLSPHQWQKLWNL